MNWTHSTSSDRPNVDPASYRALGSAILRRSRLRRRSVVAVSLALGAVVALLFREDLTWSEIAAGLTATACLIIGVGVTEGLIWHRDHEAAQTLWWYAHHVRLVADRGLDAGDRADALCAVESEPVVTPWQRFQRARIAWRLEPTGAPRDDVGLADAIRILPADERIYAEAAITVIEAGQVLRDRGDWVGPLAAAASLVGSEAPTMPRWPPRRNIAIAVTGFGVFLAFAAYYWPPPAVSF